MFSKLFLIFLFVFPSVSFAKPPCYAEAINFSEIGENSAQLVSKASLLNNCLKKRVLKPLAMVGQSNNSYGSILWGDSIETPRVDGGGNLYNCRNGGPCRLARIDKGGSLFLELPKNLAQGGYIKIVDGQAM